MDVSKLATSVHHLQQNPSATNFQQVGEEAKRMRTEALRALNLTADLARRVRGQEARSRRMACGLDIGSVWPWPHSSHTGLKDDR